MFSNRLIRSLSKTSDEENLKLSEKDWHLVLEANQHFSEDPAQWRGGPLWGRFLLNKLGPDVEMDFRNSLELCCGNGFVYFSLRDFVNYDLESYHMDLSETQLSDFSVRCNETNTPKPTLIQGDIGKIPFPDNRFRLVYGNSYLHHLPDVGLYLAEVLRILQKGGRYIAFHEPTATAPLLETFPRSILKKVDDSSLTDIWLIRPEVIESIMKRNGFSEVRIYPTGLFYGLLISPINLILAKLGSRHNSKLLVRARIWMDKLDALLPLSMRRRICPSICIVGVK